MQAKTSDRLLGLFLILLGVLFFVSIIPWQAQAADYGWLKPRTLPRILAVVLGLCGLALLIRPPGDARPGRFYWARAMLFAGVLVLGLAAMSWLGFVLVAPPMALLLMWLAHERRPLWLLLGAAGMPAAIWFTVAVLLDRPLP
ncbi:tripartite tricarboxylate transporter TctB family protein [Ruegeria aquimaris]|uniref:Tripartite tricarboxylate transporter TctB family protein n=1 Tax=Ruegeria aquimaris TaxID=2984333 RepID=A0ABT3AHP0_9RHOB|nr:tripartite tricarboxylate transporter TctB family protein [Ruegeria sp. XHP0148]MCV2888148.1 tripartite tricarboxylate transporter TctB family protein [Ruegeria sp. XHP0148]